MNEKQHKRRIKASVQSAVANGSWCGAQRQQCGDSGSDLIWLI